MDTPRRLSDLAAAIQACRRCDLWRHATRGVPGEGPGDARILLVGEQPGDQEDLAGRPFVGPAGRVLDEAMAEAEVYRHTVYITNAVKHFAFEPRGKRRIHRTPATGEIQACRWWLEIERGLLKPAVIVALGATAARSVFGRPTPVAKLQGQAQPLPEGAQGLATYHPSYVLRLRDPADRDRARRLIVLTLRLAAKLAG